MLPPQQHNRHNACQAEVNDECADVVVAVAIVLLQSGTASNRKQWNASTVHNFGAVNTLNYCSILQLLKSRKILAEIVVARMNERCNERGLSMSIEHILPYSVNNKGEM